MNDRFRAAHVPGRPLLLPNAWDHASAAALIEAGFTAIGTTSLGVAAAHGLPDGTGATRDQTLALARRLASLPGMISVDIEAGFSDDPVEVAAFAAELAALGVVGINIEDGRADGALAGPERLAALVEAIKERQPALFVNARTDAFWIGLDDPLRTSIARAARYREAGADGIFVPGATAPADIAALTARIDAPVNLLYAPGGLDITELADLGAARISTGSLLFRAALDAAIRTAESVRDRAPVPGGLPTYQDVQRLHDSAPH